MKDSSVRFVCKYCVHACSQYSMLVLHKLELHPLEYAEEKRERNFQKTQKNSVTEIIELGKQLDIVFSRNEGTARGPLDAMNAQQNSSRLAAMNAFRAVECPSTRIEAVKKEIVAAAQAQASTRPSEVTIEKHLNSTIYESGMRKKKATIPHLVIENENSNDRRPDPMQKEEPKTPSSASLPYDEVTDTWLCPFCSSKYHAKLSAQVHIKLVHKNEDMGDFDLSAELHSPSVLKNSEVHFKWDELNLNLLLDHSQNIQADGFSNRDPGISSPHDEMITDFKTTPDVPPYACVHCGCSFKSKLNHLRHYYHQICQVNSQPRYSKFLKCSAESTKSEASRHKKIKHTDNTVLSFNAKQSRPGDELIRAALSNSRKPEVMFKGHTKCPYCSKVLRSDRSFQIHLRLHSGYKPFQCIKDSARFINFQGLAHLSGSQACEGSGHVTSSLSVPSPPLFFLDDSASREQILTSTSESCLNAYENSQLENMKISSADQTHSEASLDDANSHVSCPHCRKDFRNVYYLAIHMSTHQGGKPFRCSECGSQFASSPSLSRHRRTHERRELWRRHSQEHPPVLLDYSAVNEDRSDRSVLDAVSGTDSSIPFSCELSNGTLDGFSKGISKTSTNDELTAFVNELIGDLQNGSHNDFINSPSENSENNPANSPIDMTMDSIDHRLSDGIDDSTIEARSSTSNDPPIPTYDFQESGHSPVSIPFQHEHRSVCTSVDAKESGEVSTHLLDIALLFQNIEFVEEAGSESSKMNPAEPWEVKVTWEQLHTPQILATQAEHMGTAVDIDLISTLRKQLCAFGAEIPQKTEEGNSRSFDIRADHCYSREHEENYQNASTQT